MSEEGFDVGLFVHTVCMWCDYVVEHIIQFSVSHYNRI